MKDFRLRINSRGSRFNPPHQFNFIRAAILLMPLVALVAGGCSKEDMDKMVSDVKQSASDLKSSADDAVSKVKETTQSVTNDAASMANLAGKGTLQLDAPVEFGSSFIRLIPLNGTTVLQIKSNKDGAPEKFPSFLIQGEVDAVSLDAINGQSIPCQVFAQTQSGGDVWSNNNAEPVFVTIQKNGEQITAKFDQGKLMSAQTDTAVTANGSFDCIGL